MSRTLEMNSKSDDRKGATDLFGPEDEWDVWFKEDERGSRRRPLAPDRRAFPPRPRGARRGCGERAVLEEAPGPEPCAPGGMTAASAVERRATGP